ncbi:hypothetical protein SAMN05444274_101344 [Mariniphaga anaerophila]|uniref:Uncharacterized protein n=1 Tax=Mariniphaga anaerophila TaxID=1484053 RepID=A0A1M4TF11_9BACT|nr:hypothetical protein SAMN05444274_101344 [Mariniphaga anaerophila]
MDCKNMLNFNIYHVFSGKKQFSPEKTARKSTNFEERTNLFVLFFQKIKIGKCNK